MGQPNWGKLYEQGRCKAVGVPWSEADLNALYVLRIPLDYVRNGITTLEAYEAERNGVQKEIAEKGEKPLRYRSKVELVEAARQLGLTVDEVSTTRNELIALIESHKKTATLPVSEETDQETVVD